MHGNDHTRLVASSNVYRVAATLPSEFETQAFGNSGCLLGGDSGQFGAQAVTSTGLIKISSSGIGNPSSTRVSR